MANIPELNDENFDAEVLESELPVLVDFGAGAQYDEVSLSLDGANYTDCVETAGPPSQTFNCTIANADIATNNTFTIVATSNDSTP